MLKGILYLVGFCFSSLVGAMVIQASPNSQRSSLQGWYLGGSLGGSQASGKIQFGGSGGGTLGSFVSTNVPIDVSSNMIRNSLTGALFGGYGYIQNHFYLGGELSVFSANYKMTNSASAGLNQQMDFGGLFIVNIGGNSNISTQTKLSPVQGAIALRPGYLVTDRTLLYGRVGAAFASKSFTVNTNTTATAGFTVSPDTINLVFPLTLQASKTKHVAGLQLGGGFEQKIRNNLSIRLDYIYTNYGRLNANAARSSIITSNTGDVIINFTGHNQVWIISQSLMLGLTYLFNDA